MRGAIHETGIDPNEIEYFFEPAFLRIKQDYDRMKIKLIYMKWFRISKRIFATLINLSGIS